MPQSEFYVGAITRVKSARVDKSAPVDEAQGLEPVVVRLVDGLWFAEFQKGNRTLRAKAPRNQIQSPHLKGGFYDLGILDARTTLCNRHPHLWPHGFRVVTA